LRIDSQCPTPSAHLDTATRRLAEAGLETPHLEARLLLAHALGVAPVDILRGLDRKLTLAEVHRFEALVSERIRRVPLAYLRGTQEFYGLTFEVNPAVLIPRPETELLVEFAVEQLGNRPGALLIDVGTGSGCIAVAAAVHLPHARLIALDISADALAVAKRNAKRHNVEEQILFARGNLLNAVRAQSAEMILSNPPYIPTEQIATLQPEIREFEPRAAVDGGADGLVLHNDLIAGARYALRPGGWIGLEVALGQAPAVAARLAEAGFQAVERRKDLAGIERMVMGRQPAL